MATLTNSDLIMVLGARFGLMIFYGRPPLIPAEAKVIQVDIQGEEIGRNRKVDLGIVGDIREVLKGLIQLARQKSWPHSKWRDELREQTKNFETMRIAGMAEKRGVDSPH